MTSTAVTAIEVHVVDPAPPPPSFDVQQAARGTRQALADCGHFPRVGTIDEYLESEVRSGRAVYRCFDI